MTGLLDDLKNAFNKPNNSLYQLIAINIVVFVITGVIMVFSKLSGFPQAWILTYENIAISSVITEFIYKPWTLITYMFAHDLEQQGFRVIFHILFNMLALFYFGQLIMEYLGSKKVLSLYVLGGVAGGLLYLLLLNTVPALMVPSYLVGASAAVYAIVVAAATLLPDYTFFLLFLGPVRIKYIAAVYIFISFLGSVGDNAGGEISHLGGALIGFIFIVSLRKGNDLGKPVIAILDGIGNLFKRKSKIKVSYNKGSYAKETSKVSSGYKSKSTTSSSSSSIDQDEIDAILDKISQSGYDKLTTEEKQKLFKASQKK
jgi:membrane associated rhomboid family serine protease